MNTNKTTARIVGALFLIAMVTSLLGGVWLESITGEPGYLAEISSQGTQVLLGVLLELINCLAVVGIAAALFPLMRVQNEALAAGYLGARVVEVVVLSVAAIGPLLLVTLSEEYLAAGAPDAAYFETAGTLVMAARGQLASLLTPIFFSLGALLLYVFLYRSRLVPRFISVWGFIAVAAMFTLNMVGAFGLSISAAMVFVLPMILNEIFLGIWLLVKGFNASALSSEPA
ncbi:MAG: DUF4386 domain-containing protein [Anaerolineae bacterium]|jgi:hypothetical protein